MDDDANEDQDEDDDSLLDDMYDTEQQNPSVFRDGQRYLGIATATATDTETGKHCILLNTVQSRTFFRHPCRDIVRYLRQYSLMRTRGSHQPKILQLIILSDDTYAVCDKTIWLRLVQRRWKRALALRQTLVQSYLTSHWIQRQLGHTRIRHIQQLRGLMVALS